MDACRATWLPDLDLSYKFFVGAPQRIPNSRLRHVQPTPPPAPLKADTIQLDAPDVFSAIAPKIRLISQHALANNFTRLVIADTDVYLRPERLARFLTENHSADAYGFLRENPDYIQGSLAVYGLNAMERLATSEELAPGIPDDVCVGRVLKNMVWKHVPQFWPGAVPRLILPDNDLISTHKALPVSSHQFPHSIYSIHALWKNRQFEFREEKENVNRLQST